MLILTRKPGESLFIGDKIKVVVVEIKGNQIRLGIEAPSDVRILREEIYAQILEENKSAAAPVSGESLEGLSAVLTPGSSGKSGGASVLKAVLSPARKGPGSDGSNHGSKKR
jgi:carbon storage regulator